MSIRHEPQFSHEPLFGSYTLIVGVQLEILGKCLAETRIRPHSLEREMHPPSERVLPASPLISFPDDLASFASSSSSWWVVLDFWASHSGVTAAVGASSQARRELSVYTIPQEVESNNACCSIVCILVPHSALSPPKSREAKNV